MDESNYISLFENILFILFNLLLILLGILLWNNIWIKKFGAEIPIFINDTFTYFRSTNIYLVLNNLYEKIHNFDKVYLLKSIGYDGYIYLFFQRKIISLLLSYFILELFLYIFENYANYFLNDDKNYEKIHSILYIIFLYLNTFLHFRCFNIIKKEAYYIYFSRFDKMSQKFDLNFLSSRTLHISGLAPEERNTDYLQNILNNYLEVNNVKGKIIDINFIPNYNKLFKLEKEKNEINELKLLINEEKNILLKCFNSIYYNTFTMEKRLLFIDDEIQDILQEPIFNSGHAFICFNSLKAAYQILSIFKKTTFMTFKLKLKSLFSKKPHRNYLIQGKKASSTFQRFYEEDELDNSQMVFNNDNINNLNILIDQMIEPIDIIWENIGGGDRGLFVGRRIILNIVTIALLLFVTTPMSLLSTMQKFKYFKFLQFEFIIKIKYGYIIITYIYPIIILIINIGLIELIDYICILEKNYTHSNYHCSFFEKSFIYMLLNFLIIPSLALSYEPLYQIFKYNFKDLKNLLTEICEIYNNYYFYITLFIQNGTFGFIFYLLRINELLFNFFSTTITYYKRHFINIDKYCYRNEKDVFLFGYFYSQYMVFYSICLVFSNKNFFLLLSGMFLFQLRHIGDFFSLLMVHLIELDSNGKLINHILNYNLIPILIYHFFSFFNVIEKDEIYSKILIIILIVLSILYFYFFYYSEYIINIYVLNKELSIYENQIINLSENQINKWRNKYKHPSIISIFTESNSKKNN